MKALLHFLLLSVLILPKVFAQNTIYGTGAGTGGNYNTHIGYYAGKINTGTYNTFLGIFTGYSNTSGNKNVFIGGVSGSANSTGNYNTFLGFGSGQYNTTGNSNTFVGQSSGSSNSSGVNNTFLGDQSGYANTTGSGNSFLGNSSGRSNTNGSYNIFLGGNSGYGNTTGHFNTFIGISSGSGNTGGSFNTFLGSFSGLNSTTGANNTLLGYHAGSNIGSGSGNVFIGYRAGFREAGSNKLYIDNNHDSYPLIYGNFSSNVVSIGMRYTGTTYKLVVPGRVRATAYDVVSDERLKKDVNTLQHVLAKVQKIKGVSYGFKENAIAIQDQENGQSAKTQAEEKLHYGFLAQNIKEFFPELVTEDEGFLAVNYQGMIPVLVEAVKELSLQKDSLTQLQKQLDQLKSENSAIIEELAIIKEALGLSSHSSLKGTDIPSARLLEQNIPNPFTQSTSIRYQVATQAQQVSLVITNLKGVTLMRFDNLKPGAGEIEVAAGRLAAGTYVYTLIVDGKPMASQRMILTR